jgi:hypothetical protein
LSNVYLSKALNGNHKQRFAIDRIVYDFDLNDPTDIYFLEDDEKFTELMGKHKVVATVKDQQEIADTQNIYKINLVFITTKRKNFSRP